MLASPPELRPPFEEFTLIPETKPGMAYDPDHVFTLQMSVALDWAWLIKFDPID